MINKVTYRRHPFPYPATCFSVRLAASSAVTAQGSAVGLFLGSQGLCPASSNKSAHQAISTWTPVLEALSYSEVLGLSFKVKS